MIEAGASTMVAAFDVFFTRNPDRNSGRSVRGQGALQEPEEVQQGEPSSEHDI